MYHFKGTTSKKCAELYGEGNERQLCVGDWKGAGRGGWTKLYGSSEVLTISKHIVTEIYQ